MLDASFRAEVVSFRYGDGDFAIEELSIEVAPGEAVGVLGPNGCGKTTFLRVLSGYFRPQAGRVLHAGEDLHRMPARERARRLAVVSDASPILFSYTCLEIVLMGRTPYKGRLELDRPEDEALARESLERAGAAGLAEKRIDAISSGERQKVLLAAALCQEPKVLLMDEPTVHLDVRAEREVFAVVDALRRERGIAVIAVLHDLHRAARSCDRVLFLRGGRAVAAGRPDDVMTPPTLERVYGVRLGRFEREGKIYFD